MCLCDYSRGIRSVFIGGRPELHFKAFASLQMVQRLHLILTWQATLTPIPAELRLRLLPATRHPMRTVLMGLFT